jgi:hypothetical protein
MLGSGRSKRGLVLFSTLLLGLGIGAFVVASLGLATRLFEPHLGIAFTRLLFGSWLIGFALGATLMGRMRSWSRTLLLFLGLLALGAGVLLPDFVESERIADWLGLAPRDFGAVSMGLLLLLGIPAGGMLPSFSRRATSLGVAFAIVFAGAGLGAYSIHSEVVLSYGRNLAMTASGGLGALLCLGMAIAPTAFRKPRKGHAQRELSPIGGPMGIAPSVGQTLADARTPRPRLRPRHAGALGALITPWSLLLFGLCLELGGLLLGDGLGVDLTARMLLLVLGFGGLALGALLIPHLFQSDARGVSGLLLFLSAASVWLVKSDELLAFADQHGLWPRLSNLQDGFGMTWNLRKWGELVLVIAPPLAAMGATIPVLATSLVRDEPGRRIGGILGMGALGGILWIGLQGLPVPTALGISVALAALGVIFVEVAPGGGVGRVRNPMVRMVGRLARLTTLLVLGLAAIYVGQQSAPHIGIYMMRAQLLSGLKSANFVEWERSDLGSRVTFGDSMGAREVRWSEDGQIGRPVSLAPFHLAQLLAKPGAKIARLDQREGDWSGPSFGDLSSPVTNPRSHWRGRELWPWDKQPLQVHTYDMVWLGHLRPASPDSYHAATQEALGACREVLAPGGLVAALLDPSQVTRRVLQAQLATFAEAFPWSAIWLVEGQVLLTGAEACPAQIFPPVDELDHLLRRWIFREGLGSEAEVLGHFIGELAKDPNRSSEQLLTDSNPWALLRGKAQREDLPRNLGLLLGRATLAPAAWPVRETAEARVALLGARAKGQARIAKAWVDFYRATAPSSIAQSTWEDRLGAAMIQVLSLVPEDPEALALEREIVIAALRQEALSVLRKREPARAITPLLEATGLDPNRGDLQLMLTAAFRISRYEELADASRRTLDKLAPNWPKSELAQELISLGFVPKP